MLPTFHGSCMNQSFIFFFYSVVSSLLLLLPFLSHPCTSNRDVGFGRPGVAVRSRSSKLLPQPHSSASSHITGRWVALTALPRKSAEPAAFA